MPVVLWVLDARPVELVLRPTLSGAAKSTYCKKLADKDRKPQYADRTIHFHSQSTSR